MILLETPLTPWYNNPTIIVGALTFVGVVISLFWNFINAKKLNDLTAITTKNVFIHKLQFEKEFEIYQKIWDKLISIKFDIHSFKVRVYQNEIPKEEIEELWNDVISDFKEFELIHFANEPFYSKKVTDSLNAIGDRFSKLNNYVLNTPFEDNNMKTHLDKFELLVSDVCNEIRNRIHNSDQ